MPKKFQIIVFFGIIFLLLPLFVNADTLGQKVDFFIDSNYDLEKREKITATLEKISPQLYFYLDDNWWSPLVYWKKEEIRRSLNSLAQEFENKIYSTLTNTFGFEWKPGIDKDERITILIHPMIEEAGGYFNTGDEYPKAQNPDSNEREMVYLNAQHIQKPNIKSFLAHEFQHLITFNQKDRIQGVTEEVWLNEARSEYTPTLLGYDDEFEGSNLQNRVKIFLEKPYDSLTEWKNQKEDYGVLNLFTQYLVDHYGIEILVDSLQSSKVGIPSLNYALTKNGFKENFSQIFTDFTITVLVNDCSLNEKYCYKNENLENLQISAQTIFLPLIGESALSIINTTKQWASNWHKIIGGKKTLKLEFQGDSKVQFRVPYLVEDLEGKITIDFLKLDSQQKGIVYIPDFTIKNNSLTIIPSIQSKFSGFDGLEPPLQFSFIASIVERSPEEEAELIKKLLAQIEFLEKEIARLQAQINAILAKRGQLVSCQKLENNLYFGMRNNPEVRCLQEFLKSQGPEIYPEGLVTGNFLSLTKVAVIRFQEKYASEILVPLGLQKGTGYVGSTTRSKINELLGL